MITFDPALAQPTQASYLFPVYDTLVLQRPDGDVTPHLATSWSQPDPTTWRFQLRDDVVFHDGTRFDAAAVERNLERAGSTAGNPNATAFSTMTDVVVVNDTTVDVLFSEPAPAFLLDMSHLPGMMVSPAALQRGLDLTRDPQGSGPWTWDEERSRAGIRQEYVRNERYWAPELQGVQAIEIVVVPDNAARLSAVLTGQADVAFMIRANQIATAQRAGLRVHRRDVNLHWIQILDRGGELAPPLADPRVRAAIAHAVDREGYVAAVLDGVGSASGGLISPALTEWYDPALAGVPEFDPSRSRQLLAEAGLPDGFDVELPTMPLIQANVEAVAQMLEAVGIDVELVPIQNGQLGATVRSGSAPLVVAFGTEYHPHQMFSLFASGPSPNNPFRLEDTAPIDEGLRRAARAEPAEARRIYSDIARDIIDLGIMIPIAFEPVIDVASADVSGLFIPLGTPNALPYGVLVQEP